MLGKLIVNCSLRSSARPARADVPSGRPLWRRLPFRRRCPLRDRPALGAVVCSGASFIPVAVVSTPGRRAFLSSCSQGLVPICNRVVVSKKDRRTGGRRFVLRSDSDRHPFAPSSPASRSHRPASILVFLVFNNIVSAFAIRWLIQSEMTARRTTSDHQSWSAPQQRLPYAARSEPAACVFLQVL